MVSIIHEARTLSLLSIDIKTDAYVLRFIDMINVQYFTPVPISHKPNIYIKLFF